MGMRAYSRVKGPMIQPSFRRMPESSVLVRMDPGFRRDDVKHTSTGSISNGH